MRRVNRLPDAVALAVLLAVFFAVNDVPAWIRAPYWLDEDWVALSTRVPLKDLPKITSSTPIGWTLLLRVIPDPDALRLLPLAFILIALLAAYLLGRLLPWRDPATSVLAGFVCSAAVVLLPADQLRHDLKQYTADAAVTLSFLAGTAWLERSWSRRRLVVVVAAAPVALLLSQITLIVAPSTFAGLVVVAALRRDRRRLLDAVLGCAVSLAVLGLIYEVFAAPNRTPALTAFWSADYPSAAGLPTFVHRRVQALGPSLGYPRPAILLGLLLAGVVVLVVLRRTATLVAVVVMPALTAALGVAHRYPLLDERTCYFLFAAGAALTGIAVAGAAVGLARAVARRREVWWRTVFAGVLVVAALSAFATVNHVWYRFDGLDPRVPNYSPIAISDVRTQTRWVDAHRAPGDVVLIGYAARYGYAFYHDTSTVRWTAVATNTVGWVPAEPADPDVIVVDGTTVKPIADAVDRAVARARDNGPGARILIVRTWWGGEADAWNAALRPYAVTHPYAAIEPVAVIANP
jgi:hypothetical protein